MAFNNQNAFEPYKQCAGRGCSEQGVNYWSLFTTSQKIKERILKITTPSIFYKGTKSIVLESAYNAVRFWEPEYYESDFDNAKKLGLNAFRLSLEWSRIQPNEDQWNEQAIEHYKKMLVSMRSKGLNPILTFNHITLPFWILSPPISFKKKFGQILLPSPLKEMPLHDPIENDSYWKSLRGWENSKTVEKFIEYVARMTLELRDLVDYWITITEPVSSIIGGGYISGLWPPGFCLDGNRSRKVLHNLIEAHIKAYDTITKIDDIDADGDEIPKKVGIAHMMIEVRPDSSKKFFDTLKRDNIEAAKNFDYFVNDYFLNAIINGEEDINYLNTLQRYNKASKDFITHTNWRNKLDFIGINYYRRVYVYQSTLLKLTSARFIGGVILRSEETHSLYASIPSISSPRAWYMKSGVTYLSVFFRFPLL
jgi:beta-glucosidase/6-phospho-beta-glucosidase/beta-galactosidase